MVYSAAEARMELAILLLATDKDRAVRCVVSSEGFPIQDR